ncbi:nascent polypeptide-associated complex subunit alpha, muscle-specific form-like [Amphibalanus amphitrite]|uniref:nascent polypeptide-associated complex subunit alpha, muscle-specific form-like n=1 Tax=Amphibalanus amphitrite TaxID=1232801 RepID=UPI001C92A97A|nr:nascent polypeptide-associated complex subunit alpha, muscle-specific form-like [Amphibalanus amphitrite]XP_043229600.1 nascent polypeptide-associated complex subunit alpha, muscle-specific form-like [Amphibalanus amphitrite]
MDLTMERARRLQIRQLGPELTCHLCHGYFVDAFTVVECLHSFCKACIVQHVKRSSECPRCGLQLNKARLAAAIRPDQTLQSVVYKLVPRLFNEEMQRRRDFYKNQDHSLRDRSLSPERRGDVSSQQFVYTLTEPISFSLEFARIGFRDGERTDLPSVRYFQAPAGLGISQLKKLLRLKHGLRPRDAKVDILYKGQVVPDDLSVMDVACQYNWDRAAPMAFFYRWTRKRAASTAASTSASTVDPTAPPTKRSKNSCTVPEARAVSEAVRVEAVTREKEEQQVDKKQTRLEGGARLGASPLRKVGSKLSGATVNGRHSLTAGEAVPTPQSPEKVASGPKTADTADTRAAVTPRKGSDSDVPQGFTGQSADPDTKPSVTSQDGSNNMERPGASEQSVAANPGPQPDPSGRDSHPSTLLTNGGAAASGGVCTTSAPGWSGSDRGGGGATRCTPSEPSALLDQQGTTAEENAGTSREVGGDHHGRGPTANGKCLNVQSANAAPEQLTHQANKMSKSGFGTPKQDKSMEKGDTMTNVDQAKETRKTTNWEDGGKGERQINGASNLGAQRNGHNRSLSGSSCSERKTLKDKRIKRIAGHFSSPHDKSKDTTYTSLSSNGTSVSRKTLNPSAKECALEPGEILKSPEKSGKPPVASNGLQARSTTDSMKRALDVISPSSTAPSRFATSSSERSSTTPTPHSRQFFSREANVPRRNKSGNEDPASVGTPSPSSALKDGGSAARMPIDVYDFDDEAEENASIRLRILSPTKELVGDYSKRQKLQRPPEKGFFNGHETKKQKHNGTQSKDHSLPLTGTSASTPPINTHPAHSESHLVHRPHPSNPLAGTVPQQHVLPDASTVPPQRPAPPGTPGVSAPHRSPPSPAPAPAPAPAQRPAAPAGGQPSAVPPSPRRSLASLPALRPIGAGAIPLMTGQLDQFLWLVSQSAVSHPNGSWRLPADASALLSRATAPSQPASGKPIRPKPTQRKPSGDAKQSSQVKSASQSNFTTQTNGSQPATYSVQNSNATASSTSVQDKSMKNGRKTPHQASPLQQSASLKASGISSGYPSDGMLSEEVSITRIPRSANGSASGRPSPSPAPADHPCSPAGRATADGSVTIEKIRAAPASQPQPARPPNSPKLLAIAESLAMKQIQAAAGKTPPPVSAAPPPSALGSLLSLSQSQQLGVSRQPSAGDQSAARCRPVSGSAARRQIPNPALLHQQSQGRLTVLNVLPAEAAGTGSCSGSSTSSGSLARMERLTNSLGR